MDRLITWFMTYPSRVIVTEWFIVAVLYCVMARLKQRKVRRMRRFVYCAGKKSNVLYVDMVTDYMFDNYQRYVGYGVIDRNNTSIYFDVPNRH